MTTLGVYGIKLNAQRLADGREGRGLGEMDPLQIRAAVGCADSGCKPSHAVLFNEVLEDRARLEHRQLAILDDRELARRGILLERMTRRIEGDGRELVRNTELLESAPDRGEWSKNQQAVQETDLMASFDVVRCDVHRVIHRKWGLYMSSKISDAGHST